MAVPERFLDELIARTDLVDLVSETVRLTKKGRNYWGLCPFHSEKTPSFSVSADKQIFKCFGCGKGGGAINFVMEMENLPFWDAVVLLSKRAGMEVPERNTYSTGMKERREKLLTINREAARAFHRWLHASEGEYALSYLQNRGLSRGTLTRFGLGFAPNSWDALILELSKQGYDKRDLLDAGLAVSNQDGRIYDRFRNRVIFPIIDVRGDVIGFGGRVMDDSTPKYLNSPDSFVYNKSRNVFALNIAKKSKSDTVILTEGYMDTITLHQAGFDNAVASLGTSLTQEHAQLLSRYFHHAILSYDSDTAGVSAAQRAIPLLEKAGLQVRVLRMTGAKDPDEYIKQFGRDAFSHLLEQSENQVDYRLHQIQKKYQMEDDNQKVAFLHEAAQMLSTLSSAVEREVYGNHAAAMAGISSEAMSYEIKKAFQQRVKQSQRQKERQVLTPATSLQPKLREFHYENFRSARAEEGIIRLLVLDPSIHSSLTHLDAKQFSSPLLAKAYQLLMERAKAALSTQLATLAMDLNAQEMDHLTYVISQPESLANSHQSLSNYISIVQEEALKRTHTDDIQLLIETKRKTLQKKAYMEDQP